MRKQYVLAQVLLCFVVAGCAAPTPSPPAASPIAPAKSGVIRYVDLTNFDVRDMPMQMALDALAAEGYTVQPIYLAQAAQIVDSLARGDADIGWVSDQSTWAAIAQGAALRTVAQTTATTAILAARIEITTCDELDGQPVGITSNKGQTATLLFTYLQRTCPDAKPNFLILSGSAERAAALQSGEIVAVLVQNEELLKLEQTEPGKYHALVYLAREFPEIQVDGLQVRQEWAEQHPEMVKDFIAALLTAHRRVIAEPDTLAAEAVKRLEEDPATAKIIADADLSIGVWDANGGLTPESIQSTLDFLVSIDALPAGLTVEGVSDLSYLTAVLDKIGRQ